MISSGFSALDNCIGGLKKGKLYTLAGFNFTPPWIVEHFAINMLANSGKSGFVYADSWGGNNPEVWENKIFFSVGESGKAIDFLPDLNNGFRLYQDKAVKTARIEEICGRFSALQRITPFDIAVFDIRHIDLPKRKFPSTSGKRADHITGIFQKLAEAHNIPIILLDEFCNLDIAEKVSTNQFRRPKIPIVLIHCGAVHILRDSNICRLIPFVAPVIVSCSRVHSCEYHIVVLVSIH